VSETKPIKEMLAEAKTAEAEENPDEAIALYEQVLQQDELNETAYNRLMVIYRKQKDNKKELAIINIALSVYQKFYKAQQRTTKTITTHSNKLNKAFGFTDKKGNNINLPEPVATWQKRKELLIKKKMKK